MLNTKMSGYVKTKPSSKENPIEQCEAPITPTFLGTNHDPEEQHIHDYQIKKSMLTKVKDMAFRWRNVLVLKKHSKNVTPAWGVSLDDDDDDLHHFGSSMYESELGHESNKEANKQERGSSKSVPSTTVKDEKRSNEGKKDKGVPAKDTLSPKKTSEDTLSPKKTSKDMGVVTKMREAVSYVFRMDSSSSPRSQPTTTNMSNKNIPVTTNAQAVDGKENHARRILQAN